MQELTTAALQAALDEALARTDERTDALAQDDFSAAYPHAAAWQIGPFHRDDALTFRPEGQWADPLDIGWTSGSIFNPSIAPDPDGDGLVMFYRASPTKESMSSRIGMARLVGGQWVDEPSNPVIFPGDDLELLGCEDPKLYRSDGTWFLFYNGIFRIDEGDLARYPSPGYPLDTVGCDIRLAVSDDLQHWTRLGSVMDLEVSRLWAKGAVIPRDGLGSAVRIGGEYLMFVSEGCDGVQHIGRSDDVRSWIFEPQPFLDLGAIGGHLHEVACIAAEPEADTFVLDFFYRDAEDRFAAGQALYGIDDPFTPRELALGGSLAWGGLSRWRDRWVFGQGWDAAPQTRELFLYRS